MKEIYLTKGAKCIVDDEDFERFGNLKWQLSSGGYACRKPWVRGSKSAPKSYYLHREILGTPAGFHTDHINGDKLDNRRENLRIATPSQNQANERLSKNNTTGYRGVIFSFGKFRAQIKINRKTKVSGSFQTAEQAYECYKKMAIEAWGEFAKV